jgi:hypothetical protein
VRQGDRTAQAAPTEEGRPLEGPPAGDREDRHPHLLAHSDLPTQERPDAAIQRVAVTTA